MGRLEEISVKTLITIVTTLAVVTAGCGGQANTNVAMINQNSAASVNQNATPANPANGALPASVGSLSTPTEAYRTAYALREKKDVAGLKRVMSKDVLDFLSMVAAEEKQSVDEQIAELFLTPQWKAPETRNEKINGDRASLEYKDESGELKTMDFVKEGQEWKLSLPARQETKAETGKPGNKQK